MKSIILNGDCIKEMGKYPDNYFDSIVTDPPYGLGKEPDANQLLKDWIEKGYHEIQGKGFMGKEWDAFVPQPNLWKEVFRVLKPGGHVLAFYGTRTYDWGVMAMRLAGFEVRDCIQWLYGSGFPKSHNIGKAIDKIEGNEREYINGSPKPKEYKGKFDQTSSFQREKSFGNSEWEGWGSALKPANEPIVLARKPLEKGLSIAENVLKWGTGGINIDGTRIEYLANDDSRIGKGYIWKSKAEPFGEAKITQEKEGWNSKGRFPANVILDEIAAEILDKQSGISKSNGGSGNKSMGALGKNGKYGEFSLDVKPANIGGLGDVGGASRFFYVAKASKSERNKGLEGFNNKPPMYESHRANYENTKGIETPYAGAGRTGNDNRNNHPTVKPVKLMQYLVRLVTPPNGIVLDPFCGSGTTGVACKIEGFQFVGMEQDPEYAKIAEARIKNTLIENTLW